MNAPTIYTKADVDIEMSGYQYDAVVNEIIKLLETLYQSSDIQMVGISPIGNVAIGLSPIAEEMVQSLRQKLKDHVAANYPAIAAKCSQKTGSGWLNPRIDVPEPGVYMVINEEDYERKAMYYKEGRWEWADNSEEISVLYYRPMLPAPEGVVYSQY